MPAVCYCNADIFWSECFLIKMWFWLNKAVTSLVLTMCAFQCYIHFGFTLYPRWCKFSLVKWAIELTLLEMWRFPRFIDSFWLKYWCFDCKMFVFWGFKNDFIFLSPLLATIGECYKTYSLNYFILFICTTVFLLWGRIVEKTYPIGIGIGAYVSWLAR